MDVSIAVSLIRGQMGTVVERAVNVAVETVLAEMLKVVGVKFEELKAQLVLMKKDIVALQREKALKEKENDNIRAKLRYTELKLKYYRQGVEEELQQRASASTLVRIHPPAFTRIHRGLTGVSAAEASMSCSAQTRTTEGATARSNQVPECTSSQSASRRAVRVCCPSDVVSSDSPELLLPVSLTVSTPVESLDSSTDPVQGTDVDLDDECEWTITLQPQTEAVDAAVAPPPVQPPTLDEGQQSAAGSVSPDRPTQADSSTLPSTAPQVKQEEEEEVICIKEEPEEEQQVMETLLLDCQVKQSPPPESQPQRSVTDWSRLSGSQMTHSSASSSASPTSYPLPPLAASLPSLSVLPPGIPPRQAVRPWTKDLSLYEEYKLRRNELRRRNLSRRRELEKTLPQPLLADLVRERREKTRLRVARWRAKRKLQACLNQAQAHGGAAGLSQTGFPVSSQQLRPPAAPSSQSSASPQSSSFLSSISSILPFIPSSSSSSSLLLRGSSMAPHEHTVTSSSSSSFAPAGLSQQSASLTDADVLQ
ncbi:pinin-like [Stegastes partitus]|uniref:Pinin-like n=1 Tax=Stegastes partitus TaxID=144197 RepID=A0A9Y4K7S4_9TELE|nr:PREDICTED: pinin-like [Stegastes partitus]